MTLGLGKLRSFSRRTDPFVVDCAAAVLLLAVAEVLIWTAQHLRVPLVHALWGAVIAAALAVRRLGWVAVPLGVAGVATVSEVILPLVVLWMLIVSIVLYRRGVSDETGRIVQGAMATA